MERALFTWLHLSDIHAGHGQADHRWDQTLVLQALSKDIKKQREQHPNVDAIFVTGDIAFSGGARDDHEYAVAGECLHKVSQCTGVPNERVFLVPGNHDVDRGVLEKDPVVLYTVQGLRSGVGTLDHALDSSDTRAGLERRLARYLTFAGGYALGCGKLFWDQAVDAASGVRVRVVGLNTALLSQDDTDKGKLRLGNQQLALLQSDTEEGDEPLVIVLSHHPVSHGWLDPAEDNRAWSWIRQHGLYLCGHEHDNTFDRWATGGGQDVVRIMSGSVHRDAGEPETHGYCWCCLLDVDGVAVLRYWPRVWSPANMDFRPDVARTLPDQLYAQQPVSWSVPARLRPAVRPSTAPPVPGPAVSDPSKTMQGKGAMAPQGEVVVNGHSIIITGSHANVTVAPIPAAPNLSREDGRPHSDLPRPPWADGSEVDRYGLYADIRILGVVQRFRWMKPGSFLMGSPTTEMKRYVDEAQHAVALSRGFWLADTACTQALWRAVTNYNPSRFKKDEANPVEQVSWDDVQDFLVRVNEAKRGLDLRLPTEAEWEYACRATTTTPFCFGDTITPEQVNYNGNYPYGGARKGLYRKKTVPVKSLSPNGWGLHEMHGNVWEWCADWYGASGSEAVVDPSGPAGGDRRVMRGGSWHDDARDARSADRFRGDAARCADDVGFRLARG